MARETDRFIIRLPDGMRDDIAGIAKNNARSMNSEIVHRLRYSLGVPNTDDRQNEENTELLYRFNRLSAEQRAGLLLLLNAEGH